MEIMWNLMTDELFVLDLPRFTVVVKAAWKRYETLVFSQIATGFTI